MKSYNFYIYSRAIEMRSGCSKETYEGYYGGEMNATTSQAANREDCERECFSNMKCQAASFTDRSGSSRCLLYYMESYPALDSDSVYWKTNCGPGITY